MVDQPPGMSDDHPAGSIIRIQHMIGGNGKSFIELEDVLDIRASKPIDHLVVIADRKNVVFRQGNNLQ